MMNRNEKNNCHYRDCKAITENLSPIKKEAAEIFGSKLTFCPKMIFSAFCLTALLSAGITGEARAKDCVMDEPQFIRTCRTAIDYGKNKKGEYICGTDCTFTIEGTTVKIKANSANARINEGIFSPYHYVDKKFVTSDGKEVSFNKIELDGDFAYIGDYAFSNSGATVTTTSGVLNVNNIGTKVFRSNKDSNTIVDADVYISSDAAADTQTFQTANIKGDLVFADGVTAISAWFMGATKIDGNVVMPSSLTNLRPDNYITLLDTLNEGHKVYCEADNCYELFYNACQGDTSEPYYSRCINRLDDLVENKQLSAYPDGCTKLGLGMQCSKCKNENFKLNDGECDRLRWTPAEAAKVLHDDNTNSVTITFKK